jgi:hypothetical protein
MNALSIYRFLCVCGKVHVVQTGHTITAKCKEHELHIQLHQPEKSPVAEHYLEISHKIDFGEVIVLARSTEDMDRLVKEATEI